MSAAAGSPPMDARALLARAMEHHQAGRTAEAEQDYLGVVAQGYRRVEVLRLLAGIAFETGRFDVALDRWREVLAASPGDLPALAATAAIFHRLGRWNEAVDALQQAAAAAPDNADIAANLGVALFDAGREDEAYAALHGAAAKGLSAPLLEHQRRRVATAIVPSWHIPMMNDAPRNAAFERAIAAAVKTLGPQVRVLDIGTGSGLLSLMAARSGAAKVTACEVVPAIAAAARRIVELNGCADRVKVVEKRSTDLAIGPDMDERADLLVSEILSSTLLTEGVLATFEDAITRLLKPRAAIIPCGATAVGCLAGGEALERMAFVGRVNGLDLSAFTELSPQRLPLFGFSPPWRRLSADHDLVRFDLTAPWHDPGLARIPIAVTADGVAVGIVQWMRVDLDAATVFTNPPETHDGGGWQQVLHTFTKPIRVAAGQNFELLAGHDRASLIVMPA